MTCDPFTISVIQAGLTAAADEMFAVLRKTAMSPIIYEVLDVGTGIMDGTGNLVSSGAGIPTFVGVLDKAVQFIIGKHGQTIAEGDVFVTNDPNFGGVTHLNDVVIAKPVFFDGECVAWTASIAHWGDVGGKVPGSMATDVTEIFAEGLRLPCVRLIEKGREIAGVFDIIRVNSRLPDFVKGDLWAQLAASRSAEKQINSLFKTYGTAAVLQAIEDAYDTALTRSKEGLAGLPKGTFAIEEEQDDGAIWRSSITITDDEFLVDLRDNPIELDGPYNTSRDGSVISCQMIFKALTDPERFANAGSFAPLRVLTKEKTIFHAGPTAPQGYYFETRIRLFDLLWQCMAKAIPERLPAGSFSSIFGTVIAGVHPDFERNYTMVEPQMGGWGATSERDGMSAMFSTSHGDTFNCPVEICEARYGLNVVQKGLAERAEYRNGYSGGHGVRLEYELRADAILSAGYTRARIPVWSKDSCPPGGVNSLTVVRKTGEPERYQFVSGLKLTTGDRVIIQSANGGNSN
ncbi:hydantoinase B/oxoprolinase family protein [uncultured Maritalea sp.]|uniref:hydantoinase B/oxoprolinase family protein n=1 Tax=uncultured Maritalea sp. TaxID=757249 RepID=UPI00262BF8EE|nr:hydantoinase B/oxoprolinase family protein [uncultured Maritalea sp.]